MLPNAQRINLRHQRLWLLPQKAIWWQKQKTLLVADLHIGKTGHFRKNGIPVPAQVNERNFEILNRLIDKTSPRHIIFLGDLFHSHWNEQWQQFRQWRRQHPAVEVSLVVGNHDILERQHYHAAHISVFRRMKIDPFHFVHDVETAPESLSNSSFYLLGGHLHPAIKMQGKGRQSMKFPCFYFGDKAGILPAFGRFTGTALFRPPAADRVFIIVEDQVLPAGALR